MAVSDSDNEVSSKIKARNGKKPANDSDAESEEPKGSEAGDEEEEDEEYEIEAILNAKRSNLHPPDHTYWVRWKGYSKDHNSWVEERDAEGAKELISEFWHKQKAKEQSKSKGSSAKPRKSATRDTESAAPSAVKKRKKAKDESDDDDGAGLSKASKKRGSASAKRPSSASAPAMDVDMDEDSMEGVGMMEKYMDQENWEKLIDTVDTVERGADGELYVYFTLRQEKERHRQTNTVCRKRFPQKLISFYEHHLRWKQVTEEGSSEA